MIVTCLKLVDLPHYDCQVPNGLSDACVVLCNKRLPYRRSADEMKCLKVASFFLRYTND